MVSISLQIKLANQYDSGFWSHGQRRGISQSIQQTEWFCMFIQSFFYTFWTDKSNEENLTKFSCRTFALVPFTVYLFSSPFFRSLFCCHPCSLPTMSLLVSFNMLDSVSLYFFWTSPFYAHTLHMSIPFFFVRWSVLVRSVKHIYLRYV